MIGLACSSSRALAALAFTVLPTVFVLRWFAQASSACAEATRSRCQVKVSTVTAVPGVVTSLARRDGTLPACGFCSTVSGVVTVRA